VTTLLYGLLFAGIAASGVLIGAAIVLRMRERWPNTVFALLAFAAGTLLGAAFLGLLPGATSEIRTETALQFGLVGVLLFFLMEKTVLWRHCHDPECPVHSTAGYLILIGDGVHNAVDGLIIGAAFVTDAKLGVMTGLAVLAHEIPQEIGDFALLLEGGLSTQRALVYNVLSAATIFPGVMAADLVAGWIDPAAGTALAIAAGGFIYVALADLVPMLHRKLDQPMLRDQIIPLFLGVVVLWVISEVLS
jgi:zinc and cadmium transporter